MTFQTAHAMSPRAAASPGRSPIQHNGYGKDLPGSSSLLQPQGLLPARRAHRGAAPASPGRAAQALKLAVKRKSFLNSRQKNLSMGKTCPTNTSFTGSAESLLVALVQTCPELHLGMSTFLGSCHSGQVMPRGLLPLPRAQGCHRRLAGKMSG